MNPFKKYRGTSPLFPKLVLAVRLTADLDWDVVAKEINGEIINTDDGAGANPLSFIEFTIPDGTRRRAFKGNWIVRTRNDNLYVFDSISFHSIFQPAKQHEEVTA